MNYEIKIDFKKITREALSLSKPGRGDASDNSDVSSLMCFEKFKLLCDKKEEYDFRDMCVCAALLFEMQIKNNVPSEYIELSERFEELVKENKKLDVSERRDFVFFAYEVMREIERLENLVEVSFEGLPTGISAVASQDDDISAVGIVNNSDEDIFVNVILTGLPGRHVSIDYYRAGEYEPLSIVCNTDSKLSETNIMIPVYPYTLHLFKIR